jgi:hypothetical protein
MYEELASFFNENSDILIEEESYIEMELMEHTYFTYNKETKIISIHGFDFLLLEEFETLIEKEEDLPISLSKGEVTKEDYKKFLSILEKEGISI